MGCANSKFLETPRGPLQDLQYNEAKRKQCKLKQQKWQRQIAKIQKKNANKQKHHRQRAGVLNLGDVQQEHNNLCDTRHGSDISASAEPMNFNAEDVRRIEEYYREEYKRKIELKTRLQLENELFTFLLNQIVLTTQFFAHFESEVANVYEELLNKENLYNQNLTEQSVLFANPLDVAVSKWLKFKPIHGRDKHCAQPLQTQVMYVVFENIDIVRPNDANYDSIAPLCKVLIETDYYLTTPCKLEYTEMMQAIKWKGYVRLKLREDAKMKRSAGDKCSVSDDEESTEIYTDNSSGYSTAASLYSNIARTLNTANSIYNNDTDYDYVYITRLNTQRPIAELRIQNQRECNLLEEKILPESCLSRLAKFIAPGLEDTDDEQENEDDANDDDDDEAEDKDMSHQDSANKQNDNKENNNENKHQKIAEILNINNAKKNYVSVKSSINSEQERRNILLQQNYLNSKEFMHYFGELLRQKLATKLAITQLQLLAGTYRGCSIYTEQYEIIPTIHVPHTWPDCAFPFRIRERPIVRHPQTGQQLQWPTRAMIKRIETFGFHVIPIGYAPKRQRNPFRELEWRIVFPKAERYLERHLSNTQIKVFMLTKALVKTFIVPHEKYQTLMFAIEYLRTHLFWECERNYAAWPEEFLGEALLHFIRSFMTCLGKKQLPDYFIEERNLFENIPEDTLVTLHSIMSDIAEYPLMHLMIALRNLEHAADFYPKLNFKKLVENIVEHDMLKLRQFSKFSRSLLTLTEMTEAVVDTNQTEETFRTLDDGNARGLLGMQQHQPKTKGKLRKKTQLMRYNIALQQQQLAEREDRRESIDSIELELILAKHARTTRTHNGAGLENLRRTNLLELLLSHILAMLEKAIELRNRHIMKLYLAQAHRLCNYYHDLGCDLSAKNFLADIHNLETKIDAEGLNHISETIINYATTPPALPRRFTADHQQQQQEQQQQYPQNNNNSVLNTKVKNSLENLKSSAAAELRSTPEPKRSIKFIEHVIEVQEADTNPIQRSDVQIVPVGILRTANSNVDIEAAVDIDTADQEQTTQSISARLLCKLNTTVSHDAKMLQKITARTEQMLQSLTTDEKCVEFCDLLKRQSMKVRSAFNQTS